MEVCCIVDLTENLIAVSFVFYNNASDDGVKLGLKIAYLKVVVKMRRKIIKTFFINLFRWGPAKDLFV